jgi:predicted MFS family arabinose efflux permease
MCMVGSISIRYYSCYHSVTRDLHLYWQISTLICALANVGSASAGSYGGVMVGRVFNGISASVPLGIGAATV